MDRSQDNATDRSLSRRRFLGVAAAVAGGAGWRPLSYGSDDKKLRVPVGRPPSRVVQVQSTHVVDGTAVHRRLVGEMLTAAMTSLTGKATLRESWHALFKRNDVIGLKFNRSGQAVIGTTPTVAEVLIKSLITNGWEAEQIVCIEAPPRLEGELGTTRAWTGYDVGATEFESGSDELARVVGQVTALVSVPFLKTHNIAGMTCSLKNLSHGLVRHPARYHAHGCSPYIADIIADTPLGSKLRLCLVDALRVAFEGGPDPSGGSLSDEGYLVASTDPVATDAVGLALLNDARKRKELPVVAESPEDVAFLAAAHRRGLGVALWHGIDHVPLVM